MGWRTATGDVRANTTGLVMAKEMGDDVAVRASAGGRRARIRARVFGEHQEKFGWFFNNKEAFPRGQSSAMLMAAEIAGPGDWTRAFEAPYLDKFTAPTVEGIDFPSLGVSQAWNDLTAGTLRVVTYAAAPEKRGAATRWRVTNLPGTTNLTLRLNGQPFTRFAAVGPRTIEITTTIDAHQFEIVTGYRGDGTRAAVEPPAKARPAAAAASLLARHDDGTPIANAPASRECREGGSRHPPPPRIAGHFRQPGLLPRAAAARAPREPASGSMPSGCRRRRYPSGPARRRQVPTHRRRTCRSAKTDAKEAKTLDENLGLGRGKSGCVSRS